MSGMFVKLVYGAEQAVISANTAANVLVLYEFVYVPD